LQKKNPPAFEEFFAATEASPLTLTHTAWFLALEKNISYTLKHAPGNTKGGIFTAPLTSCLIGLD
jgi:hypothetical protein